MLTLTFVFDFGVKLTFLVLLHFCDLESDLEIPVLRSELETVRTEVKKNLEESHAVAMNSSEDEGHAFVELNLEMNVSMVGCELEDREGLSDYLN
jgi:hypothetical protein